MAANQSSRNARTCKVHHKRQKIFNCDGNISRMVLPQGCFKEFHVPSNLLERPFTSSPSLSPANKSARWPIRRTKRPLPTTRTPTSLRMTIGTMLLMFSMNVVALPWQRLIMPNSRMSFHLRWIILFFKKTKPYSWFHVKVTLVAGTGFFTDA